MQAQARQWAEGHVHIAVEDRLIAQAAKPKEEAPLPEMKPVINPMSEKILARRGPIAPQSPHHQVRSASAPLMTSDGVPHQVRSRLSRSGCRCR